MKPTLSTSARLALAISLMSSMSAQAAVTLHDDGDTSFSSDGYINAFYTSTDVDRPGDNLDRRQSRVKMGFLPNYIGFNVSQTMGNLDIGARSSFWVTINDSDDNGTATAIDVRQFYGTVGGAWGEVLIGKDFGLFARSNIMQDEILMGFGHSSDALGLLDGTGVSFGNIGSGYPYPFPTAQITYRTPDLSGLNLAIGIMDPNKIADSSATAARNEEAPRFESEVTYSTDLDGVSIMAWVNGQYQKSETNVAGSDDITSTGIGYGAKVGFGGLSLSASGFDAEGVNPLFTNDFLDLALAEQDTSGFLAQGSYTLGDNRFAVSYGENEDDLLGQERDTTTVAVFHTVNANFTLVGEVSRHENVVQSSGADIEESDTVALGAVLTW